MKRRKSSSREVSRSSERGTRPRRSSKAHSPTKPALADHSPAPQKAVGTDLKAPTSAPHTDSAAGPCPLSATVRKGLPASPSGPAASSCPPSATVPSSHQPARSQLAEAFDNIKSKLGYSTRAVLRQTAIIIARVCSKDALSRSASRGRVTLLSLHADIEKKFNIQITPQVFSKLLRYCPSMEISQYGDNDFVWDRSTDEVPELVPFCLHYSAKLLGLPKSLKSWDNYAISYSHSQVLDFGDAVGSPKPVDPSDPTLAAPSAVIDIAAVSCKRSICPNTGDPSYHAQPIIQMEAHVLAFLRLIRVVIRDMIVTLKMATPTGYVKFHDLVHILIIWSSNVAEE